MLTRLAHLLDAVAARIERAEGLDPVADRVAAVADKVLGARPVVDVASGSVIGHPLHPLLVTLPIGSWASALVLDATGDPEAADTLVGLGLLTAVPTALTGASDWRFTLGAERRIGFVHAVSNNLALTAYALSWLARRAGRRRTGVALSLAGATTVSVGGWLGGHLSYAQGVGVDTTAFQRSRWPGWTYLTEESLVPAAGLHRADLDGVPLLVTRDGDRIVALADRCTHRGGPLHEGELRGGCVVCPWHGSTFALDGAVVTGPAQRPQPAYEVRVSDGQVLVRRADEPRTLRANPVGV